MDGESRARTPTRKYLDRQDEILRVASLILNRKGLKEMTLAAVADSFGLVSTGVAYYFRSKEDLAAACFRRAIAEHNRLILQAVEQNSLEERLAQLVSGYFAMLAGIARGESDDIALFEDIRSLNDPALEADYVGMFRNLRRLLAGRGDHSDRGRLNARTHYLVQQLIWARYWLAKYEPADYPRAAERMADILIRGVDAAHWPWAPQCLPTLSATLGDADDRREMFLRAATQLINEQGYRGASVERIVARLDVTKGSFYYRIDAKDDLIEVCYERTIAALRRAQQAAEALNCNGRERLVAALAHLIGHQLDGQAPLLRIPTASVPDSIRRKILVGCDRIDVRFGSMLSDAIADGSVRTIDPQIASHMLTATAIAGAELPGWLPGGAGARTTEDFVRPAFEGLAVWTGV